MPVPARKKATYEDVLNAPDHVVAEILDGELLMSPRPASPHAFACTKISAALDARFNHPDPQRGRPGGWWIVYEPELHFGEEIVVPDLAGWRRERMPVLPSAAFLTQAPDWVCEILSPSSERTDRVYKMDLWAREGVGHAWLVDPVLRLLEVYRLSGSVMARVQVFLGNRRVQAEPFEAAKIDMGPWWAMGR